MMITVIKKSLILTVFICLVTLGSVFSNANIGTENWSYKIGDSPIDSNGNFVDVYVLFYTSIFCKAF